jgi:hypothetical protein
VAVQFPAFCPTCGFIFQSSLISISGGGTVKDLKITGARETCPACGAMAELPDGTFDVVGDTIHVLSASQLTLERLRRLEAILKGAQRGEMSDEAAAEAVAAEDPELARLIEALRPKMGKAVLGFILIVLQILGTQWLAEHRDHSATREDVQQAVEQAMEKFEQHPPPQPPSPPAPPHR